MYVMIVWDTHAWERPIVELFSDLAKAKEYATSIVNSEEGAEIVWRDHGGSFGVDAIAGSTYSIDIVPRDLDVRTHAFPDQEG